MMRRFFGSEKKAEPTPPTAAPRGLKDAMVDFLNGDGEEWEYLEKESYLAKLLAPGSPDITHQSLVSKLRAMGPRQVCQYQVNGLYE